MSRDLPAPGAGVTDARCGSRRWQRLGIRPRILAWYVVLLSIATAATILVERGALINNLDNRIDNELAQEVDEFRRLLGGVAPDGTCWAGSTPDGSCEEGRNPETGEPFGDDMAAAFDTFLRRSIPGEHETMITIIDGRHHASSIDTPPLDLATEPTFLDEVTAVESSQRGEIDTPVGPVRYVAVAVGPPELDAVFAVAQFLTPQLAQVRDSVRIAAIANLIVLGIASALAYLATSRILRPIRLVTETATAISDSDLSRRIPVQGDDEVSRLAATFNAMLDRLEDAFDVQRRFFTDAGHELRTPITIVRGNLELLPDDPVARARSIDIATTELDRMSRMVQDLLTLAKAERPDFLTLGQVDVEQLVLDIHDKVRALAPRDWTVEISGSGSLLGDEQRLTQAMIQLAENATAATDPGDRITLGCAVTRGSVRLYVRDTGIGITADDRARIFERFHRGTDPRGEGSGLGLSIVSAIARAHGGSVDLQSRPGAGSTFTLHLPAAARRRQQPSEAATELATT